MHASAWTIVFQTINFLILVWLLQRFLYRPVLAAIDRRQAETTRVLREAEEARRSAESLQRELTAQREGMAAEQVQAVEAAHAAAQHERDSLLAAARAEGARLLAETHERIDRERGEAVVAVEARAASLAVDLAQRLLATAAPAAVPPGMVTRVLDELRAMPVEERSRLLSAEGKRLEIAVAPGLPERGTAELKHQLEAIFGQPLELVVATDNSLLTGIELRFPHAVLRHTWRASLDAARRELEKS